MLIQERKLAEYRKQKRLEQKKRKRGDDDSSSSASLVSPDFAAMMGFSGFGGSKKS